MKMYVKEYIDFTLLPDIWEIEILKQHNPILIF